MTKETFVLVSLEEEKAKQLAQVISNDTCRKILDYLSSKEEATEAEISKQLKIPISTVHYNLQLLLKNNIIQSKEFKWSEKGKEMNVYKLAKKIIVIAPKSTKNLKDQLKTIIPVALTSLVATGIVYFVTKSKEKILTSGIAQEAMVDTTKTGVDIVAATPNFALWFLYGALFSIFAFIFYMLLRKK